MTWHNGLPTFLREAAGPVYHYTSCQSFLSIISSSTLRASEASSLNDIAEVRQGWDLIHDWISNQPASETIELLKDLAATPAQKRHQVFILSASLAGDDASQWRLYAEGGSGYALKIDARVPLCVKAANVLKDAKKTADPPEPADSRRQPLLGAALRDVVAVTPWLHVLYSDHDVFAALDEIANYVDRTAASISNSGGGEEELDMAYQTLQGEALGALATVAHLVKGPGFVGENEARIVATFPFPGAHVEYRAGAHGIIGHVTLVPAPNKTISHRVLYPAAKGTGPVPLPIGGVNLGPLLPEEHENTVRPALRSFGYSHTDIHRSQVPLRP